MFRIPVTVLLLFLLSTGCKPKSPQEKFIADNRLEKYDKVYLVACLSCSECMLAYFKTIDTVNALFVYDDKCSSKFLRPLQQHQHLALSQANMDSYFGEFGNVLIITKDEQGYRLKKYPER